MVDKYEQNRSEKEKHIFHALVELMQTRNVWEITVSELAKQAGISRSGFYRLFESVDDVVKNMENDMLETMRDICRYYISKKLDLSTSEIVDETILSLFQFLYQTRDAYVALNSIHGDPQFR